MQAQTTIVRLALAAGIFMLPLTAQADDADKAACVGFEEGDDCTRGDGDPGVCVPDDSDPVLTCEDTGYVGPGADGGGCNLGGGGGETLGLAALALGLVALRRRPRAV